MRSSYLRGNKTESNACIEKAILKWVDLLGMEHTVTYFKHLGEFIQLEQQIQEIKTALRPIPYSVEYITTTARLVRFNGDQHV